MTMNDYMSNAILHRDPNKGVVIFRNDVEQINAKYFSTIIKERSWYSRPGASKKCLMPKIASFHVKEREFTGYKTDNDRSLDSIKRQILPFVSEWEGRKLTIDEFTICPSNSIALNTCFHFLKSKDVSRITHEAPARASSVDLAREAGFRRDFVSTSERDNFCLNLHDINRFKGVSNQALVLTQPKIGFGKNRLSKHIDAILDNLGYNSFLLIDESEDLSYTPSFDRSLCSPDNVLRVKKVFQGTLTQEPLYKSQASSGTEVSIIFHHEKYRTKIAKTLRLLGGGTNTPSIKMLCETFNESRVLQASLAEASATANNQAQQIRTRLRNSPVYFDIFENAQSCYLKIPFKDGYFFNNRKLLLEKAKLLKVPLDLGSSTYFPYDMKSEWIRLNLLSSEENILRSIEAIDKLARGFS